MNKELCWLILPLVGLLSQIGGTWWKAARRYFIPLVSVGMLWIWLGDFWYAFIPLAFHMFGAFTFPITKFGDSIPGDWRNWCWVPFWACVLCSPVLWLSFHYWHLALNCAGLLTLLVMLSNFKPTAKYFQWKLVEMFEGILPLIPICYLITLQ